MLAEERLRSENYLEKALKHERETKNCHMTIMALKNEVDALAAHTKETAMLEAMFVELKTRYATMQNDHTASASSCDKQSLSKNDEIARLGDKVENVNYNLRVPQREPNSQ